MKEVWKDIENFNGKYQISNYGRIKTKSYERIVKRKNQKAYSFITKEKFLKIRKDRKGNFMTAFLYNGNKTKEIYIAREVVKHFIKPDLNKKEIVIYKDNDFTNCKIDNLLVINIREYLQEAHKKGILVFPSGMYQAKKYEFYGKNYTIKDFCNSRKIKKSTIKSRLHYKWNIYEAVEIPIAKHKGVNC